MKPIIDISFWQAPSRIDYPTLAQHIDGVILRAAYAASKDTRFDEHYKAFDDLGVPIGAYHYIIGTVDPSTQAQALANAIQGKRLRLGVWNDVEDQRHGLTRDIVLRYHTEAERLVGEMGVYTSAYKWDSIMGRPDLSSRKLWIANYQTASPLMPRTGGWVSWWLWQYTEHGRLPGYHASLDLNNFCCGEEEYRRWVGMDYLPEPIQLDVPAFSQKDPQWSNDRLGTSNTTIGGFGCLVTATAMVLKYFCKDTDPGKLNKDLIAVNGYENGNLMRYNSITTIYPDIAIDWSKFITSPSNADIDECLEDDLPVIVQVDYTPSTPAIDQHWVVIVGRDAEGYKTIDPIDGKAGCLLRYANKVHRMVVFVNQSEEGAMYVIEMLGHLRIRRSPNGALFSPEQYALRGETHHSDQEQGGWYRITRQGITGWVSGHTQWTRITEVTQPPDPDPPTELTLEEKVERLWQAHPELH
jgi:lysozyme